MIYLCCFFIFQFFQQFFQIFWVVRVEGGGVKMVKMAQNYKILSVVFYISRTVHHIWLSIMIHICKVIISPDICFHFFKKIFFLLVRRIKRQKMAQNYKILSVVFYISRTVHHIWLSIMIHICKMIISPGIFFIFSKILFFCLLGGSKGKKWPKILKNCPPCLISQESYIIWSSFTVQMCKRIISPSFFYIFPNFHFWGQ